MRAALFKYNMPLSYEKCISQPWILARLGNPNNFIGWFHQNNIGNIFVEMNILWHLSEEKKIEKCCKFWFMLKFKISEHYEKRKISIKSGQVRSRSSLALRIDINNGTMSNETFKPANSNWLFHLQIQKWDICSI